MGRGVWLREGAVPTPVSQVWTAEGTPGDADVGGLVWTPGWGSSWHKGTRKSTVN